MGYHRQQGRLRTLRGPLDQVIDEGERAGDAYLRVILAEKARAGSRRSCPGEAAERTGGPARGRGTGSGRAPSPAAGPAGSDRPRTQLFGDYLAEQDVADERVERMFADLLEDMSEGQGTATA